MNLHTLIDGIELTHLAGGVGGVGGVSVDSIRVCDLTEDSRTAMPGSLFVARSGMQDEGAKYIDQAVHAGAVAVVTDDPDATLPSGFKAVLLYSKDASGVGGVLAERFYGHPSSTLAIAGITGTNGKTTIAHLTQQIIKHAHVGQARIKCGLIGTVVIDDGRQRGPAAMTTPPAIELSRTLATMVEHGCKACAMEVSSHALDQGRTSAVEIDAAGFTNLTGDHLNYHKTIEEYTKAKIRLFASLKSGATAIINTDDPAGQVMIDACGEGVRVLGCSMKDAGADWYAEITQGTLDGMKMTVGCPHGSFESSVPFFGEYNASNVLIALGLADVLFEKLKVDVETRLKNFVGSMRELRLPRGRLERVDTSGDDIRVFVDFAHSDDSIRSCLGGVRGVLPAGAGLWCVFGCGGDRDRSKRPRMGRAACDGADRVVLTSDNPRSEKPSQIVDDVLGGLDESQRAKVEVQIDRDIAIR
ncbi:MAG: UDP-N-acetylmuramoyl-L-alanyl-D-glutamate--2,6-diaminopimelate ligase, partial [Phycisphaerales bacterium]|nr:UDP-N-acetylmuramoyl-L-alanyl-D-glutamate--2,6-diaminopimelate ligase [Phycisphaerales bacterium]